MANGGGSVTRTLNESLFPSEIRTLLRTLSEAGFFERSLLVGSWVMPIYRELYGVSYTLRTLDVDFAVHVAHPRARLRADLERLITDAGFASFLGAEGIQKFSAGGYEVEFIVHRRGGRVGGVRSLEEWKLNAMPLPFIDILLEFSETAALWRLTDAISDSRSFLRSQTHRRRPTADRGQAVEGSGAMCGACSGASRSETARSRGFAAVGEGDEARSCRIEHGD